MNAGPGTFAYAQARLQARLGTRGSNTELQRARSARDLAALLQSLRSTYPGRHVARIAPGMPVHEVERRLRAEWVATVDEIARWQPARWQPAVQWLRWLPWLPALQKLARVGRAPAWMREDAVLARIVAVEPAQRPDALGATPLAPIAIAFEQDATVVAQWLEHWRTLWPPGTACRGLEAIVHAVEMTGEALRLAPPTGTTESLSEALAVRLLRVFRRYPLSTAASVAYLGLEALDLLLLRGAFSARVALEPTVAA